MYGKEQGGDKPPVLKQAVVKREADSGETQNALFITVNSNAVLNGLNYTSLFSVSFIVRFSLSFLSESQVVLLFRFFVFDISVASWLSVVNIVVSTCHRCVVEQIFLRLGSGSSVVVAVFLRVLCFLCLCGIRRKERIVALDQRDALRGERVLVEERPRVIEVEL